jgi:hypothetical protein
MGNIETWLQVRGDKGYPFTDAKTDTLPFSENRVTYKKAEKLLYSVDFDEWVKILGVEQ